MKKIYVYAVVYEPMMDELIKNGLSPYDGLLRTEKERNQELDKIIDSFIIGPFKIQSCVKAMPTEEATAPDRNIEIDITSIPSYISSHGIYSSLFDLYLNAKREGYEGDELKKQLAILINMFRETISILNSEKDINEFDSMILIPGKIDPKYLDY